ESENLHIGSGQDDGNNFFFDGNIDDVTIWDEALDGAAIQNIMNNSIPEPTSLGLLSLAGLALLRRRR
ncbi:MAG: PEP-CTERM sorting domain-containing protein, partial [Akkermansiaceae bacterium]